MATRSRPPSGSDSERQASRLVSVVQDYLVGTEERAQEQHDEFPSFVVPDQLDVYAADVEFSTTRFAGVLRFIARYRIPYFPCVQLGQSKIPLDLTGFVTLDDLYESRRGVGTFRFRPPVMSFLRANWLQERPETALQMFLGHLHDFLVARFNARESNISQQPGRLFTVSSNTPGLRVHYSPAYFFNPNNVFGSPTTVAAWIQPGIYLFGAAGPTTPLRFDLNSHYTIPPAAKAHLYI